MGNRLDLVLFLLVATLASIVWGRTNRIGYSRFITSIVRFLMAYSKMNADVMRMYVVWCIYLLVGLVAAVALLLTYSVKLLPYLNMDPAYFAIIPLTFIAQNSLTGLLIALLLVTRPTLNLFSELTRIPWVSYTMLLPASMRVISPMAAAVVEEVFFRGAVFLVLINRFPETGAYFAILACTALFVVQQVLQTDTLGQGLILLVGSASLSIVGCVAMLYTGSFVPALICHPAYAFLYLKLGRSLPQNHPKTQQSTSTSAYPHF